MQAMVGGAAIIYFKAATVVFGVVTMLRATQTMPAMPQRILFARPIIFPNAAPLCPVAVTMSSGLPDIVIVFGTMISVSKTMVGETQTMVRDTQTMFCGDR